MSETAIKQPDRTEEEAWQRVKMTDFTVFGMLESGCSFRTIIVEMARQKEAMLQRIVELDNIRPRKIRMPDGKVMIWQCPDDLIPELEPLKL